MSFSIAETTRRLWAPRHELSCSWWLWHDLVCTLRARGRFGRHESGAFLLGTRTERAARIKRFVPYDDLDPHSLDTAIVRFDGRHYSKLWDICRREGLVVAADVHTHPGGVGQSPSDRAHPMIAQAGHLAMILPTFAMQRFKREEIGIYRYLGAGSCEVIPAAARSTFFSIGI